MVEYEKNHSLAVASLAAGLTAPIDISGQVRELYGDFNELDIFNSSASVDCEMWLNGDNKRARALPAGTGISWDFREKRWYNGLVIKNLDSATALADTEITCLIGRHETPLTVARQADDIQGLAF